MPVFLSAECADGVLELATPSGSLLLASAVLLSFCKFWYRCNRGRISDANFLNRRHSVAWRALPSARTWSNTGQRGDRAPVWGVCVGTDAEGAVAPVSLTSGKKSIILETLMPLSSVKD